MVFAVISNIRLMYDPVASLNEYYPGKVTEAPLGIYIEERKRVRTGLYIVMLSYF